MLIYGSYFIPIGVKLRELLACTGTCWYTGKIDFLIKALDRSSDISNERYFNFLFNKSYLVSIGVEVRELLACAGTCL